MSSRRLEIIPIVHTEADLGKLAGMLRERVGASAWREKQAAVEKVWASVRSWADGLGDVSGLKLYQDGLPAAEEAERIVRDLAGKGSVNHEILVSLMERGAELVGTEDAELLVREYEIAKGMAEAIERGRRPDPRDAQRSETLLRRRDMAIASRIGETLGGGDRGVLFIGMLHAVEGELSGDIVVSYPLGRPGGVEGSGGGREQGAA
jgi:hypothetical protein